MAVSANWLASGPTLLSSSNITKAKSVSTIFKSDCLIIGVLHQQPFQGNRNDIFTILAPAQQILCTEKNGDKKLCVDLIWLDWLPVHNYSDFAYDSSYLGKLDPVWLTLIFVLSWRRGRLFGHPSVLPVKSQTHLRSCCLIIRVNVPAWDWRRLFRKICFVGKMSFDAGWCQRRCVTGG